MTRSEIRRLIVQAPDAIEREIERLQSEVERLTRDAYKRAKEENDERFMRERDEARAQLAEAVELLESCLTFVPRATSTEEDTRAFLEKFGGQKQ